jgi:hypothetical protein
MLVLPPLARRIVNDDLDSPVQPAASRGVIDGSVVRAKANLRVCLAHAVANG